MWGLFLMKFRVSVEGGLDLIYTIDQFPTSLTWAYLISQVGPEERCNNITTMGWATAQDRQFRAERLIALARTLSEYVDDVYIPPGSVTSEDLHRMHIHFPDTLLAGQHLQLKGLLGEYNDCIHWLESLEQPRGHADIKLEFKDLSDRATIDPGDLDRFTAQWAWGDLTLHYAHAGKHAAEIYWNQDYQCPQHQFVAQTEHTASCYLRFRNRVFDTNKWARFWQATGGSDYWRTNNPHDPQLRLGYIKLGQLEACNLMGKEHPLDAQMINTQLVTNRIKEWTIYD
jgi:hypothetical protein